MLDAWFTLVLLSAGIQHKGCGILSLLKLTPMFSFTQPNLDHLRKEGIGVTASDEGT